MHFLNPHNFQLSFEINYLFFMVEVSYVPRCSSECIQGLAA